MITPRLTSFYQAINSTNSTLVNTVIYTDTSFVYELVGVSNNPLRQEESRNFSTYLSSVGSVMVTSPKVHEELRNSLSTSVISSYRTSDNQSIKQIIKKNPSAMPEAKRIVKLAIDSLKKDPNFLHMPIQGFGVDYIENVVDPVFDGIPLMYGDSFHYAFMKSEGITNLVCLDGDFALINDPNLNIFTDTGSYLSILIENNVCVPLDVLKYYIKSASVYNLSIPRKIESYYNSLQSLKNRSFGIR